MSSIDQAFIKAYSNDQAAPVRAPLTHRQERRVGGPHAFAPGPKRPLSEALAARAEGTTEQARTRDDAGTTVASFAWPAIAEQLAAQCADAYRRMLTYATRAGGVVGFLGVSEGVGCTTTVLATALSAARRGTRVVMVDADPADGALAHSLGFLHARTIAEAIATSADPAEAVIHSAADDASLAVALPAARGAEGPSMSDALRGFTATHAAVLVDLGSEAEALAGDPARGADRLGLDAVILVRRAGSSEPEVASARRALVDAGHTVLGVVDSFAAA